MKKALCILLSALLMLPVVSLAGTAAEKDYTVVSPYADVIWDGENAWGAYKGNLHTHSTVSDAQTDFRDMILEHYRQGFDFLAMTDHGVTGKAWNDKQTQLPLYLYQDIIGKVSHSLTDEEFEEIQNGTYPVDGTARGNGMTCVTGGNELNALTVTKCHVNGMFLPAGVGDNYLGYENDHEGAVALADEAGGLSFINHPGDWMNSNRDRNVVFEQENIDHFGDILLKYDSCLGIEVFNEHNSVTPYDRLFWDRLLLKCLPYGKTVWGFSNNDAHDFDDVDTSYSIFMMEENTVENIKKTMQTGAFFAVTRRLRDDVDQGPATYLDACNSADPIPMFSEVSVDGHTITVKANECDSIMWIANGEVIASKELTQSEENTTYVLDLDTVEGAEDFLYIRCQLSGKGGVTLTQPMVIDDGTEPMEWVEDTSTEATMSRVWYKIFSARLFVLLQKLWDEIVNG